MFSSILAEDMSANSVRDRVSKKRKEKKPKILVIYYSLYGHLKIMADSVVEGVKLAGGEPILKQADEIIPEKLWTEPIKKAKAKMKDVPVADPETDLKNIDGVIVGTPTRFGIVATQMKAFWDQTTNAWDAGYLIGKPAGVFTSTATQHGGQEMALLSMIVTLMHHGCVIVGLPLNGKISGEGLKNIDEVSGGSPYGASTISGEMGERLPSRNELMLARILGEHVTTNAIKLREPARISPVN